MRLINADKFEQEIAAAVIANGYNAHLGNVFCDIINKQPTAYDVDKVVEQIRKLEICGRCLNNHNSVETCAEFCDVGKKLKIIKSGGIE